MRDPGQRNHARDSGAQDEALSIARTSLDRQCDPGLERAGLLNELAHCEEQRGNYAAAFAALEKSGEMVLATPQARAVESQSYLQRLAHYQSWIESNGLPLSEPFPGGRDSRLVFLLGFPRSGTTLLESMLSAAPGVTSSSEAPLIGSALGKILASGVSLNTMLGEMGPSNRALLEQARTEYFQKLEATFGDDYQIFIDKQPMNTLYLAQIKLLFPGARIVFCVRDPRDVCLSCFFQWFALNGTNKLFYNWQSTVDFYTGVMNYWFTLEPLIEQLTFKVRYEDLVDDFSGQVRQLADNLGIPWDDAILSFEKINRDRYFATPSNRAVREGVKADRVSRWPHYLDAISRVDVKLAPILKRFGYV